ncbi:DUF3281 family protein [Francisella hispaniensis]|uniref:Uncharacterized protein n=1 Tax=Francisella hispaniensis FSC454 TaxID=1088883 RepID=A0AAC9NPV6_9GAMM|nr:DUF3281 family protein [Francisella hispaniensis]APD50744.1 hypothetical protein FSC454_06295 [Francisella hispaniensis FSC454]KYW85224.1 hypothetical protein AUF42_04805 [Francisella hispaniensis FSC454]
MKRNNLVMERKKILIGTAILSSALLLGSCGGSETTSELRMLYECSLVERVGDKDALCRFELANVEVSRYTNVLGKVVERVHSQTTVRDSQGLITWILPQDAREADNNDVVYEFGSGCQGNNCTKNSNPTAFWLPIGNNVIGVSGTGTVNRKTVDLVTTVPAAVIDILDWECPDCSGDKHTCFC